MWDVSRNLGITTVPFTEQLYKLKTGYEEHTTKTEISHLLYTGY